MTHTNIADTRPTKVKQAKSPPPPRNRPSPGALKRLAPWLLAAVILLAAASTAGAIAGKQSAERDLAQRSVTQKAQAIDEQYQLALQDMEAQRYDVARQRLEYILAQEPAFPEAPEKLARVLQILYATATPLPPTFTPLPPSATPTPDMRPLDAQFDAVQSLLANKDWNGVIDNLSAIRKAQPDYQVARVDGLLYLALRYRGLQKILKESNLEGGMYDLALAERFGPLDAEANATRDWARLYTIGLSFWEAIPEQAAYYFGELAAAAPGLSDASGYTARERYYASLIQYADQLAAKGDWCAAQAQYELAQNQSAGAYLQATVEYAAIQCSPPTETYTPVELTPTPTTSLAPVIQSTPTPTYQSPTETVAIPDTAAPPTEAPPTQAPPTVAPEPTVEPPTAAPPTEAPPTEASPGDVPALPTAEKGD